MSRAMHMVLTPLVAMGSEGGTLEWNSPWLATASELRAADIFDTGASLKSISITTRDSIYISNALIKY